MSAPLSEGLGGALGGSISPAIWTGLLWGMAGVLFSIGFAMSQLSRHYLKRVMGAVACFVSVGIACLSTPNTTGPLALLAVSAGFGVLVLGVTLCLRIVEPRQSLVPELIARALDQELSEPSQLHPRHRNSAPAPTERASGERVSSPPRSHG